MKQNKRDVMVACNKCGKEQEIDKESSNKNWVVYKNIKKCQCGGEFKLKLIK